MGAVRNSLGELRKWLRFPRTRREFIDRAAFILFAIIAVISVIPFFAIVFEVVAQGWMLLNPAFLLTNMEGFGGGGIRNAIVGSLELVAIASFVSIPLCVGAAIYTTEYAKKGGWIHKIVEFTADTLAGVPSIIFGSFGLILFVALWGKSLLAGALTLSLMMIPTILRTTQESLRAVPMNLREASLALGATTWSTSWRVVIRAALAGIITGILLAIGRVIGETAPLLFTTGFNFDSPWGIFDAVASLPFTIYKYAMLGADPLIRMRAYSTGIVLIGIVLVINLIANWASKKVGLIVRAGGV